MVVGNAVQLTDGTPISGVAKDAQLIAIQLFHGINNSVLCGGQPQCMRTSTSNEIAGLERVFSLRGTYNIASVNMSLGGGKYTSQATCDSENASLKAVIDNLRSAGIATIVSSGNDGYLDGLSSPACISTAISVGSISATSGWDNNCNVYNLGVTVPGSISCFSNSATFLNLLAPGKGILSAIPSANESALDWISGTSMAAPHVAGAWAVLKERKPAATPSEILAFTQTGTSVTDPRNGNTKPRINIDLALIEIAKSALTITKTGTGTITSVPAGINCDPTCIANFNSGTQVTLSQAAGAGHVFTSWGGACSGTGPCAVTMDAAKTVTATFTPIYTLSVSKTGSGVITSVPASISCGSTCNASFSAGSTVSLLAQPDYGFGFTGWGGACSATGTCVVTMNSDQSVSANFIELPKYQVTVPKVNTGIVNSEPAGILCGGANKQCTFSFSSAKLTATPNTEFEFIKWVGCQAPEGNVCYLKPSGKVTVKAVFKKLPKFNIKITKDKFGSITSAPDGLKCKDNAKVCNVKFFKGTPVTLTSVPQPGRSFAGWTGACGGVAPCRLLMDGNKAVGASFQYAVSIILSRGR